MTLGKGHLEAHHKKTISWSSERSTLAAGANFAARQAFLEILNPEDNLVDVLPAIPFAAIPDGELDVSVLGLSIPMSFDLMAGRPDEGEQLDSHFPEFEPRPVIPVIATAFSSDEIPPPFDPDEEFDVALHVQPTPTLHQIQRQVLLPGASVPEPTASKSAKRCAVCVKAFCLERHKCPGSLNLISKVLAEAAVQLTG
ncbi:hypothetical protein C8F04DRAFT_1181276 [Mycena alexandri]|uniref:Uncharacterized protein n=1 Tax=Mycena alexandri TaxID=1745969 RepID=A0AAD6X6C8_9AGAR|nr:hypothetical protein C8F04DRAFT_1181276 [Mycena alexandri]